MSDQDREQYEGIVEARDEEEGEDVEGHQYPDQNDQVAAQDEPPDVEGHQLSPQND